MSSTTPSAPARVRSGRVSSKLARAGLLSALCLGVTAVQGEPAQSGASSGASQGKPAMSKAVPFRLARPDKPLIVLEVQVNGQGPFRFVLDTGAGLTMIAPALAKTLKIEPRSPKQALGAGGTVEVHFGTIERLEVGATHAEKMEVGIMDLQPIARAIETDIDGILGYNFLCRYRVSIDYPRKVVMFDQDAK